MTKNRLSKFIVLSSFLITCCLSIRADLTQEMLDPLSTQKTNQTPLDSITIARLHLAKELDTGAPTMVVPSDDNWWQEFHDPVLNELIEKASQTNLNLSSAIRSLEASKYSIMAIKSGYYPTLSASAMYQSGQASGATMKGKPSSPVMENYMGIGLDLSWEIDVFGRIKKQTEEGEASYNASRAEYVATLTSLCAQVASVYFDLAAAKELYSTAMTHLESEDKILQMTKVRYENGISSKLDVTQANTVVLDTKSNLPSLRARIESDIDMLALLTNSDREKIAKLVENAKLPICSSAMAKTIPGDLIRRRPDVAEAEYNLASACAKAGLAQKDWLPTLSLSASVSTESHAAKNLFSGKSFTYSVAPTLAWTIFDGFQRKYNIAEAKADVLAAADNYDYAVATARQEVSTASTEYYCYLDEIDILSQAANQCQESLTLSVELYKSGLNPFTDVMNAQISWLTYENSVINARYNALSTLTTLYKALGGGWTGELPEFSSINKNKAIKK